MILDKLFADKQRVVTGVGLIAGVLIVGLINNFFLMWLFLGVAYLIAFYESMKLFQIEQKSPYFYALFLWLSAYFYSKPDDLVVIVMIVFASILAYKGEFNKKLFLPFLYPSVSFLFILSLYNEFGIAALLWLLIIVALTDTSAYFVGKSIGKRKFCSTSPNKTLEGVAGGIVIATIIGGFYGISIVPFVAAFTISLLVSISSIFGDLFESYLKRKADVKDSGNILPGHGGVLDRVDGYLFAAIIMVILLRFL